MTDFKAARWAAACAVHLLFVSPAFAEPDTGAVRAALVEWSEAQKPAREVESTPLDAPAVIAAFYAQRDHKPVWTSEASTASLLEAIARAPEHGLRPEDYHLPAIMALRSADRDAGEAAPLDLLLTQAAAKLAAHLHYGKTDPRKFDRNWNISAPVKPEDLLRLLSGVVDGGAPGDALETMAPQHWFYDSLKAALALQRKAVADGGWGTVEAGETLKPGMDDPRVTGLRARLKASGEYTGDAAEGDTVYDDTLVAAVKRFQELHGIDPDGAVGKRTLAEMNVTAAQRVDQVRVNLERARWVLNQLGDEFIVVNIPGFHLYIMKDGQPVWNTRVIVGKTYRQTPMFKSNMRTVVLNPTWTVPPTILRQDVLPKIAKDPSYLAKHNMKVIDSSGTALQPDAIDWQEARRRFPYSLVQQPGPENSLGRVKFLFPNEHAVYLHDTPNRGLFNRADRAASSGCIRVENPMLLADYLLKDDKDWSKEKVEAALAAGKTLNITLKRTIPIVLMYWTTQRDRDGTLHFFPDLYDRDPPVLRALGRETAQL